MDQKKNNNKRPDNKNSNNLRGILSLVSWALFLTLLISYGTDYMSGNARHSSSVELDYGQYRQMVKDGQAAAVAFDADESILVVTPVDGYTYADEKNNTRYVYSAEKDSPSSFGSAINCGVSDSSNPRKRRILSINSYTSPSVKMFASDSIGTPCATLAKSSDALAPTCFDGESARIRCGKKCSISSLRFFSASYAASVITGSSF